MQKKMKIWSLNQVFDALQTQLFYNIHMLPKTSVKLFKHSSGSMGTSRGALGCQ